jgi:hypothetical protein
MPTFDGGHYFLTALVPISTVERRDGDTVTSPVHALRKELDVLAPAAQSPTAGHQQSPFAKSLRTHFARLVVIDDVAYPGRVSGDTIVTAARNAIRPLSPTVAQPQDHLSCPFLLFSVDFDAQTGADSERDSYLIDLWDKTGSHLKKIFRYCQGFEATDGRGFAAYIAKCQLDTTMSFNDYYADPPELPSWPAKIYGGAVGICALVFVAGVVGVLSALIGSLFTSVPSSWLKASLWLSLVGVLAVAVSAVVAYVSVISAGKKPFAAASDSDLKSVLKSLYLRRTFTRFVIDNQMDAAATDPASAQRLYDAFKTFVDTNKPDDLDAPTQAPGVIGF